MYFLFLLLLRLLLAIILLREEGGGEKKKEGERKNEWLDSSVLQDILRINHITVFSARLVIMNSVSFPKLSGCASHSF